MLILLYHFLSHFNLKVSIAIETNQSTVVVNETVYAAPDGTQNAVITVTETDQKASEVALQSLLPRRTGKSGPAEPVKSLVRSFIPISKNRKRLIAGEGAEKHFAEKIRSVKFDLDFKKEIASKPLIDEPSKDIPNLMLTNKGLYSKGLSSN